MNKREQAFILRDAGVPIATVAAKMGVSKGRVSQLTKEYREMGATADEDTAAIGDDARLLAARARLTELQCRKLDTELRLRHGELVEVDEVKSKFSLVMRHVGIALDEMRVKGMNDAMQILDNAVVAMMRDGENLPG